jgi:hypothetical protein
MKNKFVETSKIKYFYKLIGTLTTYTKYSIKE